jgi:chromate transporter
MGCVTFGGGYAILPVIEREIIKKYGWVTSDEVLQYYSIAQITPGIIAVNVSTFIGYKRAGVAGGIVATLGFALPSVTMVALVALLLQNFASLEIMRHCFNGIKLAVGALILDTVCRLASNIIKKERALLKNITSLIIFITSFLLSTVFNTNPVLIVLCAGVCGFLFFGDRGNNKQNPGAAILPVAKSTTGKAGSSLSPVIKKNARLSKEKADELFPDEKWRQIIDGEYLGDTIYVAESRIPRQRPKDHDDWLKLNKELVQVKLLVKRESDSTIYLIPEKKDGIKKYDALMNGMKLELKAITGRFKALKKRFNESRKQSEFVFIKIDGDLEEKDVKDAIAGEVIYNNYSGGKVILYLSRKAKWVELCVDELKNNPLAEKNSGKGGLTGQDKP